MVMAVQRTTDQGPLKFPIGLTYPGEDFTAGTQKKQKLRQRKENLPPPQRNPEPDRREWAKFLGGRLALSTFTGAGAMGAMLASSNMDGLLSLVPLTLGLSEHLVTDPDQGLSVLRYCATLGAEVVIGQLLSGALLGVADGTFTKDDGGSRVPSWIYSLVSPNPIAGPNHAFLQAVGQWLWVSAQFGNDWSPLLFNPKWDGRPEVPFIVAGIMSLAVVPSVLNRREQIIAQAAKMVGGQVQHLPMWRWLAEIVGLPVDSHSIEVANSEKESKTKQALNHQRVDCVEVTRHPNR
jgi:hypothetical protein